MMERWVMGDKKKIFPYEQKERKKYKKNMTMRMNEV